MLVFGCFLEQADRFARLLVSSTKVSLHLLEHWLLEKVFSLLESLSNILLGNNKFLTIFCHFKGNDLLQIQEPKLMFQQRSTLPVFEIRLVCKSLKIEVP